MENGNQIQISKLTKKQNAAIARITRNNLQEWQNQTYFECSQTCATNGHHAIRLNIKTNGKPNDIFSKLFNRFGITGIVMQKGKFARVELSKNILDEILSHKFCNSYHIKPGKTIKIPFGKTFVYFDAALLKNVFDAIGNPEDFCKTIRAQNHCQFYLQTNEKLPAAYVRSDIGDAIVMPLNPRYM